MQASDMEYIHQRKDWTKWQFDSGKLLPLVTRVRLLQGQLLGQLSSMGFELNYQAQLDAVTLEVIKSSEIEGEELNAESVRSSVAKYLGVEQKGLPNSTREIDAIVEMMLSATYHFEKPLDLDTLFGWHSALFPTGYSGIYPLNVGQFRDDSKGEMRVVSGGYGREKVHFVAPQAVRLPQEIAKFLTWLNTPNEEQNLDLVLKAGIAHLWFVTLHPFDDGNGRLTRAITERVLAQSDGCKQRFYSLSAEILQHRNDYYHILEQTQKGDMDITDWLVWFVQTLEKALVSAEQKTQKIMAKAKFWQEHREVALNDRQAKMLNLLLTDFYGTLTTTKWAKICKCSRDSALRDINDLVTKKMLRKSESGGRSASYEIVL